MTERQRRRRTGTRVQRTGWLALVALVWLASQGTPIAEAQELQILATEAGLPVTLEGGQSARGLTPFSLSNGAEYSMLVAGGRGFEWRRAGLSWDSQGRPHLEDNSRRRALVGMILPGGGSLLSGRRLHGATEFAAAGYLIVESFRSADRVDERAAEVATWQRLRESEADSELRELYLQEAQLGYLLWEAAKEHHDRELMITGAFLGLGAVESWWFNRPLSVRSRNQQLMLDLPRMSRGRALLASFVMPGMGQAYRGQKRSAVYLGLWTFLIQEINDNFHRKTSRDLLHSHRQLQWGADGLDVGEESELRVLFEKVQDAESDLHLFTVLAGSLWAANLMDVAFTRPEGNRTRGKAAGLSLVPSPGGRLGLAWSARF
jgi:hypothetical protein